MSEEQLKFDVDVSATSSGVPEAVDNLKRLHESLNRVSAANVRAVASTEELQAAEISLNRELARTSSRVTKAVGTKYSTRSAQTDLLLRQNKSLLLKSRQLHDIARKTGADFGFLANRAAETAIKKNISVEQVLKNLAKSGPGSVKFNPDAKKPRSYYAEFYRQAEKNVGRRAAGVKPGRVAQKERAFKESFVKGGIQPARLNDRAVIAELLARDQERFDKADERIQRYIDRRNRLNPLAASRLRRTAGVHQSFLEGSRAAFIPPYGSTAIRGREPAQTAETARIAARGASRQVAAQQAEVKRLSERLAYLQTLRPTRSVQGRPVSVKSYLSDTENISSARSSTARALAAAEQELTRARRQEIIVTAEASKVAGVHGSVLGRVARRAAVSPQGQDTAEGRWAMLMNRLRSEETGAFSLGGLRRRRYGATGPGTPGVPLPNFAPAKSGFFQSIRENAKLVGEFKSQWGTASSTLREGRRNFAAFIAQMGQGGKSVSGLTARLGNLVSIMSGTNSIVAAFGITAATALGGAALAAGIRFTSQMEQAGIALRNILKDGALAKKTLADLVEVARVTPFTTESIVDSTRKLLAYGVGLNDILHKQGAEYKGLIITIGDAVAAMGGGDEMMSGVVRAIGQIHSKGKVVSQELRQLAEQGIPAYQILAEKLHLTGDEVGRIGELNISADKGIALLAQGLNERFGGAMREQSRTLQGLLSTLKDNIQIALGEGFENGFKRIKRVIVFITDNLSALDKTMSETGMGLLAAIETNFPKVHELMQRFRTSILPVVHLIGSSLVGALHKIQSIISKNMGLVKPFLAGWAAALTAIFNLFNGILSLLNKLPGNFGVLTAAGFGFFFAMRKILGATGILGFITKLIQRWEEYKKVVLAASVASQAAAVKDAVANARGLAISGGLGAAKSRVLVEGAKQAAIAANPIKGASLGGFLKGLIGSGAGMLALAGAITAVGAALYLFSTRGTEAQAASKRLSDGVEAARQAIEQLSSVSKELPDQQKQATEAATNYAKAQEDATKALKEHGIKSAEYAGAYHTLQSAAAAQDNAIKQLNNSLRTQIRLQDEVARRKGTAFGDFGASGGVLASDIVSGHGVSAQSLYTEALGIKPGSLYDILLGGVQKSGFEILMQNAPLLAKEIDKVVASGVSLSKVIDYLTDEGLNVLDIYTTLMFSTQDIYSNLADEISSAGDEVRNLGGSASEALDKEISRLRVIIPAYKQAGRSAEEIANVFIEKVSPDVRAAGLDFKDLQSEMQQLGVDPDVIDAVRTLLELVSSKKVIALGDEFAYLGDKGSVTLGQLIQQAADLGETMAAAGNSPIEITNAIIGRMLPALSNGLISAHQLFAVMQALGIPVTVQVIANIDQALKAFNLLLELRARLEGNEKARQSFLESGDPGAAALLSQQDAKLKADVAAAQKDLDKFTVPAKPPPKFKPKNEDINFGDSKAGAKEAAKNLKDSLKESASDFYALIKQLFQRGGQATSRAGKSVLNAFGRILANIRDIGGKVGQRALALIDKWKEKLGSLIQKYDQLKESAKQAILQQTNPEGAFGNRRERVPFQNVVAFLKDQLQATKRWVSNIKYLSTRLNRGLLESLIAAGPQNAGLAQAYVDAFKAGKGGEINAIQSQIQGLTSQVDSIIDKNLLFPQGVSVLQGFLGGLQSVEPRIKSYLQSLARKMQQWKGPMPVDKVLLRPAGEAIMRGLIGGLESKLPDVRSTLRMVTGEISRTAGARSVSTYNRTANVPLTVNNYSNPISPDALARQVAFRVRVA